MTDSAILLIDCPDRRGLVATIANLLYAHGANIIHADQHQDPEAGLFFMRVEWGIEGFDLSAFRQEMEQTAARLNMNWRLELSSDVPRVAIFVSQHVHCLADLLYRQRSGELRCTIPLVVSNHHDARPLCDFYGIAFHHTFAAPDRREQTECRQLQLLADAQIHLLVLARYMQILSADFVRHYPLSIINVHQRAPFIPAGVRWSPAISASF